MQIDDRLLGSVIRRYPSSEHAAQDRKSGGSGFIVLVLDFGSYAVTNRHVIEHTGAIRLTVEHRATRATEPIMLALTGEPARPNAPDADGVQLSVERKAGGLTCAPAIESEAGGRRQQPTTGATVASPEPLGLPSFE